MLEWFVLSAIAKKCFTSSELITEECVNADLKEFLTLALMKMLTFLNKATLCLMLGKLLFFKLLKEKGEQRLVLYCMLS